MCTRRLLPRLQGTTWGPWGLPGVPGEPEDRCLSKPSNSGRSVAFGHCAGCADSQHLRWEMTVPLSMQVKAAGVLCRASKNDCDLPEHCTGLSSECPEDVFQENGIPCQGGRGYCYNGACPSHAEQCRLLWGAGSTMSSPHVLQLCTVPHPWRWCGDSGRGQGQAGPGVGTDYHWLAAALAPCDPLALCFLQLLRWLLMNASSTTAGRIATFTA